MKEYAIHSGTSEDASAMSKAVLPQPSVKRRRETTIRLGRLDQGISQHILHLDAQCVLFRRTSSTEHSICCLIASGLSLPLC